MMPLRAQAIIHIHIMKGGREQYASHGRVAGKCGGFNELLGGSHGHKSKAWSGEYIILDQHKTTAYSAPSRSFIPNSMKKAKLFSASGSEYRKLYKTKVSTECFEKALQQQKFELWPHEPD